MEEEIRSISSPLRRTSRKTKPSLRASESLYTSNLKSAGLVASLETSSSDEQFQCSDEEAFISPEKPKILHANETVKGNAIFAFQKRKHLDGLDLIIQEAQKATHQVRRRIPHMFDDSGSEYEEESCSSASSGSDESEEPLVKQRIQFEASDGTQSKTFAKYTIDTEEYFANSGSSKGSKTSNNTLDKLHTPRLPQYQLQKLLLNKRHSSEHVKSMKNLELGYEKLFTKWLYVLSQNFSLLLYGLGSKKHLLRNFRSEILQDRPAIVINGFFPTLTIKSVLDSIIGDLLELRERPANLNQAVDLIIQEVDRLEISVFLLINNIEAIKSAKAHSVLAALASHKRIHLIATIDHINAPLIWDHNKLSKLSFTWWDVTTFSTYQHETECEMSSMTQQNSAVALSSLRNIFLSLTQNSKSIYLTVANYQIENWGQYYQGMAFKDLYMTCRERFIVSSDLALRAQLSEFIDHKMIKTKRSLDDGTEYLVIPLEKSILQTFVEENM
ncbi:hypothetical protein YQE_03656, partial [Dendroctonus ponderosae]